MGAYNLISLKLNMMHCSMKILGNNEFVLKQGSENQQYGSDITDINDFSVIIRMPAPQLIKFQICSTD